MPLAQVIEVMHEQQARSARLEIWQHYISNIVTMFAGEGAKKLADVLEDYERLRKGGTSEAEVKEAYSVAADTLRALELSRNGVR